jgi:hypothetical protein
VGTVPLNGWYLVTTTWREIVKHATEVGRDVAPWLRRVPQLAGQELLARISPLYAYLSIEEKQYMPHPHNAGRRLVASVVHEHGTEVTARGAFAYRLGMTMSQWACCGLMGLGQTVHVETGGPNGISGFSDAAGARPDLWGRHPIDARRWWLIEAKAAQRIGLSELRRGVDQLYGGSALMGAEPHRLLLCGTSLHDQVFMTIDDLPIKTPSFSDRSDMPSITGRGDIDAEDELAVDDDALLNAAKSQLLVYLNLRYGTRPGLRLVPLSADRRARPRLRTGSLTPLELDVATLELRRELQARPPVDETELRQRGGTGDFLVRRVSGTDVFLGMSRRLFAACKRLHEEQMLMVDEDPVLSTMAALEEEQDFDDDEVLRESRRQDFRDRYRDRQYEQGPRLRPAIRRAYEEAETQDWVELTEGARPGVVIDGQGLLEGATAETYIALGGANPLPSES